MTEFQIASSLEDALMFVESIVETVREPLVILDKRLRVIRANRAFYAMFHVTQSETEQQLIYQLGDDQWDIPELRALLEDILPSDSTFDDFEVTHVFPSIGQRTMLLNARKLYRATNHTEMILLAIEDITQHKQADAERQRLLAEAQTAQREAEQATQVRDYFLAIAAHELKNPLTSLLGNLQVMQRRLVKSNAWSAREDRSIQSSIEQARRLNQLINSLFDLSRLTQQDDMTCVPVNICALAQRLVSQTEPLLEHHTMSLVCVDDAMMVLGDELRLEQALNNLINNAVKYSPAGGQVRITVERQHNDVCVSIADQGVGIPKAAQKNLFNLFYRVNSSEHVPVAGTGIGLYVVQQIARQHGGSVNVTSEDGTGSTFRICLPIMA